MAETRETAVVIVMSETGEPTCADPSDGGRVVRDVPVEDVAAAEPPTFAEYVAAKGAALVRFAAAVTGDDHRAEDLTQDVLAKAYRRWDRIGRTDRPDVYVRRMLINASRSWWRHRSNRELPVARTHESGSTADIGAESAERDAMWRLMLTLSRRQRAVLVLRYYEDLDDATIGQVLDCSPATVRTHAMRALQALRRHHDSYDGGSGS